MDPVDLQWSPLDPVVVSVIVAGRTALFFFPSNKPESAIEAPDTDVNTAVGDANLIYIELVDNILLLLYFNHPAFPKTDATKKFY